MCFAEGSFREVLNLRKPLGSLGFPHQPAHRAYRNALLGVS
jgi:hypothetical protein